MSDKVIGIAVLDRAKDEHGRESLHILCAYPDGSNIHSCLPVRAKSSPPAVGAWEYEIKGESLHVTPSVRISTTRPSKTNPAMSEPVELFHNDGAWDVPFKEFIPGEYVCAYDLFRALNGLDSTKV